MTQWTTARNRAVSTAELAARSGPLSLASDLLATTKPRITALVLVTTYVGYLMAGHEFNLPVRWPHLLATLLGTALSCMGASTLNQVYERRTDALMRRTRNRPLPARRLSVASARAFGLSTVIAGVALLAAFAHPSAALISAIAVASYILLYTPLKRLISTSTIVGAVPGALPPLIGYIALAGDLTPRAWSIFAILFAWQIPHFLAISFMYRDDYARAGFPTLTVLDRSGRAAARQMVLWSALLLALGLVPALLGMSGLIYLAASTVFGLALLALALGVFCRRLDPKAVFFGSLLYLPSVLSVLVLDAL